MLRFKLPDVIVRGKVHIIRKADKDRIKAAAKRRAEQAKKDDENAEFGDEDRPP